MDPSESDIIVYIFLTSCAALPVQTLNILPNRVIPVCIIGNKDLLNKPINIKTNGTAPPIESIKPEKLEIIEAKISVNPTIASSSRNDSYSSFCACFTRFAAAV
jgi:hypothetical protein